MTTEFFISSSSHGDFAFRCIHNILLPTNREINIDICNMIDIWLEYFYHTKLKPVSYKICRYMLNDKNVLEFIHKLMMNFIGIELIDIKIRHYIVHQVRLDPRIDEEHFWFYENRSPKSLQKFMKLLQSKIKNKRLK